MDDPEDITSWADLPPAERVALRQEAQGRIFWNNLGRRFKGLAPIISTLLIVFAFWEILGEALADGIQWLTERGGKQ